MRVPRATYRLQLHKDFPFAKAAEILDYLAALGVSDVYASPIFKVRPGSLHGYDVTDPNAVNPELGGREGFEACSRRARDLGMGWLQDIVPNHMALDPGNRMLMDVLETGACSPYARMFDLDWDHFDEGLRGRLLAPILGAPYGEALDRGDIRLVYEDGTLAVDAAGMRFPLFIPSYRFLLAQEAESLKSAGESRVRSDPSLGGREGSLGGRSIEENSSFRSDPSLGGREGGLGGRSIDRDHTFNDLKALFDDWALGPEPGRPSPGHCAMLFGLKSRLAALVDGSPAARAFVDAALRRFNGPPGDEASRNLLDALLSQQRFRLAFWKVATEEINYRRFFTINGLISLRVEDPDVMRATHALVMELRRDGFITGLRVDHIDGLRDPREYLRRVRDDAGDVYLVVEKILGAGEELPRDWPVQGTTGYDFLNWVNGILCPVRNARAFDRLYARAAPGRPSFDAVAAAKKRLILDKDMTGDLENLARRLKRVSEADHHGRDLTLPAIRGALAEIMIRFPVYRTYLDGPDAREETDWGYWETALREARAHEPDLAPVFDYIERRLIPSVKAAVSAETAVEGGAKEAEQPATPEVAGGEPPRADPAARDFVARFQQFTGPLIAKGFEDSLLYDYDRLLSLNEVGGTPQAFGLDLGDFHRIVRRRAGPWPHAMNATATHDTKRGEDVRARLNVLAEIPGEWGKAVAAWKKANAAKKTRVRGSPAPDGNDEYFIYQTLLGAWPFEPREVASFRGRVRDYMVKAVREAKTHSAWLKPDEDYEAACLAFIDRLFDAPGGDAFADGFRRLAARLTFYGVFNSLSQALIKAAAPGVPDYYQGTELWDLSLVDPDNRRPVDYAARRRALEDIRRRSGDDPRALGRELLESPADGRVKMFLVRRLLEARKDAEAQFRDGSYTPLRVSGRGRKSVVAFARVSGTARAVAAAPRFLTPLVPEGCLPLGADVWKDTVVTLPGGMTLRGRNAVTGAPVRAAGTITAGELFADFPAALIIGD